MPSKARKRQLRSELHGQVRELAGCNDPDVLAKTLVDLVFECEARSSAAGLADKVAVGIQARSKVTESSAGQRLAWLGKLLMTLGAVLFSLPTDAVARLIASVSISKAWIQYARASGSKGLNRSESCDQLA